MHFSFWSGSDMFCFLTLSPLSLPESYLRHQGHAIRWPGPIYKEIYVSSASFNLQYQIYFHQGHESYATLGGGGGGKVIYYPDESQIGCTGRLFNLLSYQKRGCPASQVKKTEVRPG
jgi:hypothetical protein